MSLFKANLLEFFERDLLKVKDEISLYSVENDLWVVRPGINNSAGNLALHLVGNLKHFIGATLGNTGYIRHRDDEFALKNIPRTVLLTMLDETIAVVKTSLEGLADSDLEQDFPLEKHGKIVSVTHMLLHLSTHLNYHLGQINYHRRLLQTNA